MEIIKRIKIRDLSAIFLAITLIAVTISPPMGNLFVALSIIIALISSEVRANLIGLCKTKLGMVILGWLAVLILFTLFTQTSYERTLDDLSSWRKFLLLPIGLAVFCGARHYQVKLVLFLIYTITFIAVLSHLSFYFPEIFNFKSKAPGLILSNTSTHTKIVGVGALMAFVYLILNKTQIKTAQFYLLILCIILMTTNVFFVSVGRSGYIAFLVSFAFALWMLLKNKTYKFKILSIVFLTVIVFILGMSSNTVKNRVNKAVYEIEQGWEHPQKTSVGIRLTIYKETLKMIPQYWLIGAGNGGFKEVYRKQVEQLPYPGNIAVAEPHNEYLRTLIERGILGLFIFFFLMFELLKQTSTSQLTRILGVSVLMGWLASSLFFSHFSTFPDGSFIWLWLGVMFASNKEYRKINT